MLSFERTANDAFESFSVSIPQARGGLASRGVSTSGRVMVGDKGLNSRWLHGWNLWNKAWRLEDWTTIKSNCYGKDWPHVLGGCCIEFFLRVGFFDQHGNSWGLNSRWFISRKYEGALILRCSNPERLLCQSSTSILRHARHFLGNNKVFIW